MIMCDSNIKECLYRLPCGICTYRDLDEQFHEPAKLRAEQKLTNADRIRGMTDEELAEILARSCPDNDVDRDYCGLEDGTCDCVCCWFEWLEVDE